MACKRQVLIPALMSMSPASCMPLKGPQVTLHISLHLLFSMPLTQPNHLPFFSYTGNTVHHGGEGGGNEGEQEGIGHMANSEKVTPKLYYCYFNLKCSPWAPVLPGPKLVALCGKAIDL